MYIPVSHGRDPPLEGVSVLLSQWPLEDDVSGGHQSVGRVAGEVVLDTAAKRNNQP